MLNVETATIRPITKKSVVCWILSAEKRPVFMDLQSVTENSLPAARPIARAADSVSRIVSSLISITLAAPSIRASCRRTSRSRNTSSASDS